MEHSKADKIVKFSTLALLELSGLTLALFLLLPTHPLPFVGLACCLQLFIPAVRIFLPKIILQRDKRSLCLFLAAAIIFLILLFLIVLSF